MENYGSLKKEEEKKKFEKNNMYKKFYCFIVGREKIWKKEKK